MDYMPVAIGLLALQLAAFAWRINREVSMEGAGERTWFPLSDWLNVMSLLALAGSCVFWPIYSGEFGRFSKAILVASVVLIAFYPICQAAHYRLFSPKGRNIYKDGFPWITGQEATASVIAVALAAVAASVVYCST